MLPLVNPLKHHDKSKSRETMTATPLLPRNLLVLTAALVVAAGLEAARAGERPPAGNPQTDAARLVEEVLRKAGNGDLGEWSRSILDGALERAGETARQTTSAPSGGTTAPLPAERLAPSLAGGRPATAEILVFTSLSAPAASWRQWASEAASIGVPLVLRGVGEGGLRETVKRIGARLGGAEAGVAIDPRLFRLFGVTRVPAVAVVPGGVPPCRSRGCAEDPAPPHDLVTGNIGLAAALEAVALEGAVARDAARVHLRRLTGEDGP